MADGRRDWSGLAKSLGPGLVWAATAIGVSHLVQSTRAGAVYGYALVAAVILANLLKYPFFEFGPRYAAATGESLLEGYRRLGRWTVWVYLALTASTMFAVVGAVTLVTGSIATQLFGGALTAFGYSAVLLAASAAVLVVGRYPLLDALIKVIIVVLTVSTVAAVAMSFGAHRPPVPGFVPPAVWSGTGFAFLIALVGWMPSAVDISVWHSLWTLERARQTGHRPRLGEALFDFNLGYVGTALIALFFLTLGAQVFYGSGEEVAAAPGAFAAQLVGLYTQALGAWSRPVILIAAFTTMFSTTLSCVDAFPRALERTAAVLRRRQAAADTGTTAGAATGAGPLYWGAMLLLIAGSLLLISVFQRRLTLMVDVATTLSFLTSPILGVFNYRVVTGPEMPPGTAPPPWLRALAWAGLVFGFGFGALFLVWRFLLV